MTQTKEQKAESNRRYRERVKAGLIGKKKISPKKVVSAKKQKSSLKKVKSIRFIDESDNELEYEITLTDGSSSKINILRDDEEYVMQGDDRQRFCASELEAIYNVLEEKNKSKK